MKLQSCRDKVAFDASDVNNVNCVDTGEGVEDCDRARLG
jgi:hypothetical protein